MRRSQVAGIVTLLFALLSIPLPRAIAQSPQVPVQDTLSPEDLEELLGPIALYPDTLLANVMAACCYPDELAKASAYVKGGGTPEKIPEQGWEPSVQAVAKVPDALKVLAESPDWAAAIGQAYMVQSKDVMAAIQSLRAKAKTSGALASNKQQTIVEDGSTIIIESAQPQVVYVPQYQPQTVYAPPPPAPPPGPSAGAMVATSMLSFGVGMAVGAALDDNDCDWDGGSICHGGDVDIDVNRETNINRNVDRSRTEVNASSRSSTRAGSQGTAWQPNQQKVAAQSSAKTDQLSKFKGVGSGATPQGTGIPGRGGGTAGRSAGGGGANRAAPQARSTAAPARQPAAQRGAPPSPAAKSSPDRQPSAFSTDAGAKAARERGSASRSSGGARAAPKSTGGGRAGGGGGGRGGGGRGR
jgi:hypothetical protein